MVTATVSDDMLLVPGRLSSVKENGGNSSIGDEVEGRGLRKADVSEVSFA